MTVRQRPESRGEGLYALSFLGAHLAFIPILALLLPRRVAAISPASSIELLSVLLLAGGIVASIAHIVAGRWSDHWLRRHGSRRGLILIGLGLLILSQIALGLARSDISLLLAITVFQLSLNLMFAPLGALLADYIPNERKGRVAGMMNASLPLASLGTGAVAFLFPTDNVLAFLLIAALVAVAILPLLVSWPFDAVVAANPSPQPDSAGAPGDRRPDYLRIWCARLLVQLGAAFLINYFYLYLAGQHPAGEASRRMGTLATVAVIVSLASAILAGHWSDAANRRRLPMIAASIAMAAALFVLALQAFWLALLGAYVLFHAGLTAFLSVDSAMVNQLVADSHRRGELLGFMNLTNTLPAIIIPVIAMTSISGTEALNWSAAFALAGVLALAAGVLVRQVRTIR